MSIKELLLGHPRPASAKATPVSPDVPTTESRSSRALIARQPIFDRDLRVVAYELLYRDDNINRANIVDDDRATSVTLLNALIEIGLTELVGPHQAFVNLGPAFTHGTFPFAEYRDRMVLEILETIKIDAKLVESMRRMKKEGFTIALDDVCFSEQLEALIPLVDIVKLDLTLFPITELKRHVGSFKARCNAKILAEKVETASMLHRCMDAGCDLFQGYFFAKPEIVSGRKLDQGKISLLQLLAELQSPDVTVTTIDELIRRDAARSYKLLRYVNSASTGVACEVSSVRQAVTLLGINRIRLLAMMLGLAGHNAKPTELMVTALVRARTCELVAERSNIADSPSMFIVGLFSLLGAMLDQPIESLLERIPLAADVRDAILRKEGMKGELLKEVIAFEQGAAWPVPFNVALRDSYVSAIRWAAELEPALKIG